MAKTKRVTVPQAATMTGKSPEFLRKTWSYDEETDTVAVTKAETHGALSLLWMEIGSITSFAAHRAWHRLLSR